MAPEPTAPLSGPAGPAGPDEPRIAVVIPCFNVERHIAGVIQRIPERYAPIVAVDDCSLDRTVEAIEALGDRRVVLVRHERNRGVGGAMKSGYDEAVRLGADICVKMDGDGQMSAEDLEPLVAPLLAGVADYAK